MWGETQWSLPVVAAKVECKDLPYALGRTDLYSCGIDMTHRGVRHEGPCGTEGRLPMGWETCSRA